MLNYIIFHHKMNKNIPKNMPNTYFHNKSTSTFFSLFSKMLPPNYPLMGNWVVNLKTELILFPWLILIKKGYNNNIL